MLRRAPVTAYAPTNVGDFTFGLLKSVAIRWSFLSDHTRACLRFAVGEVTVRRIAAELHKNFRV